MNRTFAITSSSLILSAAIGALLVFGLPAKASAAIHSQNSPIPLDNVIQAPGDRTVSPEEEKWCKKIGRVVFQATQMRDADAEVKDVQAAVKMLTTQMREETQTFLYDIVPVLFSEELREYSPEVSSLNIFTHCIGHTDPAITFEPVKAQ